ncbi:hypothetical protein KSS87_005636 [Heliosperma pusillum]|nr:hypothetical protein KSS87_005636 [Heliosperma pusillum]
MGQAFRRAAGRLRSTSIDTSSSSTISRSKNSFDQTPPSIPTHIQHNHSTLEGNSEGHAQLLEQKDSSDVKDSEYDAMLNQMVGRISTKPGGKLEMGEAYVVRKSSRAMPRLRNTTPDTGRYEERPVAAGTLNVAQLRHILLLHQGKSDGYDKNVGPKEIAEKFRLDPTQVERIFHFVSMPAENNTRQKQHELDD